MVRTRTRKKVDGEERCVLEFQGDDNKIILNKQLLATKENGEVWRRHTQCDEIIIE